MTKFQSIISSAVQEALSDVYLTGEHPMVSRKNGIIQFHNNIKFSHKEIDNLVGKLLSGNQLEGLRRRKSVDFAMSIINTRLRINLFATTRGISLAIRILPGHIPAIEELNLHPSLHEIAKIKSGLVLTCGPTGVGKTTTVAAIINDINKSFQSHVVTLEDPIEYRFQSQMAFIQQRELGSHMPSFAQGLLDALRENPDVIFVGELREAETIRLTLNAAESGHLVIATLHASNPEEAIYRICNAVPTEAQNEIRYQLASTLSWLLVQQLVYLDRVGFRVPLLTIVRGTQPIKNAIRENKLHQLNSAIQLGRSDGMFTAERYLTEYLETRNTFASYIQTFRPSAEATQEMLYKSPLTEEKPEAVPARKEAPGEETEPVVVRTPYSYSEMDYMLTIDDDMSLQEMISKLNK